jgi:hypothetical protein
LTGNGFLTEKKNGKSKKPANQVQVFFFGNREKLKKKRAGGSIHERISPGFHNKMSLWFS